MDFSFSPEQVELRTTVRAFLQDRSAEADVRRLMDTDQGSFKPGTSVSTKRRWGRWVLAGGRTCRRTQRLRDQHSRGKGSSG